MLNSRMRERLGGLTLAESVEHYGKKSPQILLK
jgi:hypothetical protein